MALCVLEHIVQQRKQGKYAMFVKTNYETITRRFLKGN